MPIRRRQKKPNVEPQQKPKHSHAVVDPMVNPGSPAHRRQARSKADPARPHHRMVTLAQSSPSDRSARAFQSKKPTVMLDQAVEVGDCPSWVNLVVLTVRRLLPVFPEQRTFRASAAMSQTCRVE